MAIFQKIYHKNSGQNLLAALDIGSQKIACIIAKPTESGGLKVIGIGHNASAGIHRGQIADLQKASYVIGQAIQAAEKMADEVLSSVYVGLGGNADRSQNVIIETDLPSQPIHSDDLSAIAKEIQIQLPEKGEILIHSQPIQYTLDGHIRVVDPRGMIGEKLDIEFYTLTARQSLLKNIQNCLNNCHIDPQGFIKSSVASGFSCLQDDEMQIGTTLIDMGAETTSIILFYQNRPLYSVTVPLGGQDITNDIARGLNTSLFDAERLKILYGHALHVSGDDDFIDVPLIGEQVKAITRALPKNLLHQIIRARMEEIFEMVSDAIYQSNYHHLTGNRIVLTGGASQLPGITELAEKFFPGQLRLGTPFPLQGLSHYGNNPSFACATGILLYMNKDVQDFAQFQLTKDQSQSVFKKFGRWLQDNF